MANKYGQIFSGAPNPQYERLPLGLYRDALAQTRARYDATQAALTTLQRGMSQVDVGDNLQAKQILQERTGIINEEIDKLVKQGNLEDLGFQAQTLANQFLADEDIKTLLRSKQEYDAQRKWALQNPGAGIDFNRYNQHEFIGYDEEGNRVLNPYIADNERKLDWAAGKLRLVTNVKDDEILRSAGFELNDENYGNFALLKQGKKSGFNKKQETRVLNALADFYMGTAEGIQELKALTTANSLNNFDEDSKLTRDQAREAIAKSFLKLESMVNDEATVFDYSMSKNYNAGAGVGLPEGVYEDPYLRDVVNDLKADGSTNITGQSWQAMFGKTINAEQVDYEYAEGLDPALNKQVSQYASINDMATAMQSYLDPKGIYGLLKKFENLPSSAKRGLFVGAKVLGVPGADGMLLLDINGKKEKVDPLMVMMELLGPKPEYRTDDGQLIEWGAAGGDVDFQSDIDKIPEEDKERFREMVRSISPTWDIEQVRKFRDQLKEKGVDEERIKFGTYLSQLGTGEFVPDVDPNGNTKLVTPDATNPYGGKATTSGRYIVTNRQIEDYAKRQDLDVEDLVEKGLITEYDADANGTKRWAVRGSVMFDPMDTELQSRYDIDVLGSSKETRNTINYWAPPLDRMRAQAALTNTGILRFNQEMNSRPSNTTKIDVRSIPDVVELYGMDTTRIRKMAKRLSSEYNVSEAVLMSDIAAISKQLATNGMLQVAEFGVDPEFDLDVAAAKFPGYIEQLIRQQLDKKQ